MDTLEKLTILGSAAKYDICSASACGPGTGSRTAASPRNAVCHSFTPDGRCISLFKVLQTNNCQKDCSYCPNRVQRDIPRASFTPDELAHVFFEFYRRNYVEGIFLSSGIAHGASHTMEELIKTAEILRFKHKYKGYIHLKIIPGARYEYVERAAQLATRVSINIEAPTPGHLQKLSKLKNFDNEIIHRMQWIKQFSTKGNLPAGQTTQFIVGAAGENDSDILKTSSSLYNQAGLRRVYFSAFQPVSGTPLEGLKAAPVLREHRLYQCDFLMRQYGFSLNDIYFSKEGNLPLDLDPKMSFALNNLHLFPLEVNRASLKELLRVPGIGPASARRIIQARRSFLINSSDELKNMGVVVKKALPFVQINGRFRESHKLIQQLELWSGTNDYSLPGNTLFSSQSSHIIQAG